MALGVCCCGWRLSTRLATPLPCPRLHDLNNRRPRVTAVAVWVLCPRVGLQNLLSANTTSAHTDQINDAATALYVIGYVTAVPLLAYPITMAYTLEEKV